jgi:hypothetical protein
MIFLSHSWTNKSAARRLVEALMSERLASWLDEQQLDAGAELRAELRDGIAKSRVYLYLVSEASNASTWVQDELQFALSLEVDKKLKVIPVRLSGDDTPLPSLLEGRLSRSLSIAAGGAARLAHELWDMIPAAGEPSGWRVSATVRLLPTALVHTLDQARFVASPSTSDTLFLDEAYERIDVRYWSLSEVVFPPIKENEQAAESAASVISEIHRQSRRTIRELRELSRRYMDVDGNAKHKLYLERGCLQATRVLMHRLSWNCEYLSRVQGCEGLDHDFVERRDLPDPFDGHACNFGEGKDWIHGVVVPRHGHPFSGKTPPMSWPDSSPFADMMDAEVGKALGHTIARVFLAGNRSSAEMLKPDTLRYCLA